MAEQTYQQVSKVVLNELNRIDSKKINLQEYFYCLKNKNPHEYERLFFNGDNYSRDLESIIFDLKLSGKLNNLPQ